MILIKDDLRELYNQLIFPYFNQKECKGLIKVIEPLYLELNKNGMVFNFRKLNQGEINNFIPADYFPHASILVAFTYYQQEFFKMKNLKLSSDEFEDYSELIPCYCSLNLLHSLGLKNTTLENDLYVEVEKQIKKRLLNCFLINSSYSFNKNKFKKIAFKLADDCIMDKFLSNIDYFITKYNKENLIQEELLFDRIHKKIKEHVSVEIVEDIAKNNLGRYSYKENKILIMNTDCNDINIWIHEFMHYIQYKINPHYYNKNKIFIDLQSELEAMVASVFILRKIDPIWYKNHFSSYEYFYHIINEYNQRKITKISEKRIRNIVMGTQPIIEEAIRLLGI